MPLLSHEEERIQDRGDASFALIQFMREALADCELIQLGGLRAIAVSLRASGRIRGFRDGSDRKNTFPNGD